MVHTRQALTARDVAWNAAIRLKRFTYIALKEECGVGLKTVKLIVREWLQAGKVIDMGLGPHRRRIFELAPGVRVQPITLPPVQTPAGNLWRAMRMLRTFTPRDLAAHAHTDVCEVSERAALDYCQMLLRAGYLKVMRKAVPGRRQAVYQLVRDTGPRPPRERRLRAVWDDNRGEIMHISGGGHVQGA